MIKRTMQLIVLRFKNTEPAFYTFRIFNAIALSLCQKIKITPNLDHSLWLLALVFLGGSLACGASPSGYHEPQTPHVDTSDDSKSLEPEEPVSVAPLPDGPVLPRLKRPSTSDENMEKEISQFIKDGKHDNALPLLELLRKNRPDDPYLIDDQIWSCVESETCRANNLAKHLNDLKDYNHRYPKDINRRITEMEVLDQLKKHKDLYLVARQFTIQHPSIAEGWTILGEQQLRFHKPNRATLSLEKAKLAVFRRKHNKGRVKELTQAIASYVPPDYDDMVAVNEKQVEAFERLQNILLIRQDYVRGGSESDINSGGDY